MARNQVWLELVMIAQDLIAWTRALASKASCLAARSSGCATG
jgi:hypothetical protein